MKVEFEVLTDTIIHNAEVSENLEDMAHDLRKRGIAHDRSKLQEPEFSVICSSSEEFKKTNYNTPEYEAVCKRASVAVKHHYQHNRHHTGFHENGVKDMNLLDLLEMLADWRAASRRSPKLTFEESLPKAFVKYRMDETMQQLILNTLVYLGWISAPVKEDLCQRVDTGQQAEMALLKETQIRKKFELSEKEYRVFERLVREIQWCSPTDIGFWVWGTYTSSSQASRACQQLVKKGLAERKRRGHYRAILAPVSDRRLQHSQDEYMIECPRPGCGWSGLKSQTQSPERDQLCPKCTSKTEPVHP